MNLALFSTFDTMNFAIFLNEKFHDHLLHYFASYRLIPDARRNSLPKLLFSILSLPIEKALIFALCAPFYAKLKEYPKINLVLVGYLMLQFQGIFGCHYYQTMVHL